MKRPMFTQRSVRNMTADTQGVRAAAWMLNQKREQFHRYGAVDFDIPMGAKRPQWFQLAILCLKRRNIGRANPKWWIEVMVTVDGKIRHRVYWLDHPACGPQLRRAKMRSVS